MHLTITPHDPLVARDARSFGEGNGARTMEWFNPSVGAGSLRSLLGKLGGGFDPAMIAKLKDITVRGPFPMEGKDMFVHFPLDFVARKDDGKIFPLRPGDDLREGEGTNLPGGIRLCFPKGLGTDEPDFKPLKPPLFWSLDRMAKWLTKETFGNDFASSWKSNDGKESGMLKDGFLRSLEQDGRTHVKIDPESGASSEGMLFTTSGLTFVCKAGEELRPLRMAMDARTGDGFLNERLKGLGDHHPMGSERRLAHWKRDGDHDALWECPPDVRKHLSQTKRVRMILASPAPFRSGWLPGWLRERDGAYFGTPPGGNVELRLVSAVVNRWQPISGWSIERGKPQGPKALRRMAPAGSVYFLEVGKGDPATLSDLWLKSVCDDAQDRQDGFGLTLWGTW